MARENFPLLNNVAALGILERNRLLISDHCVMALNRQKISLGPVRIIQYKMTFYQLVAIYFTMVVSWYYYRLTYKLFYILKNVYTFWKKKKKPSWTKRNILFLHRCVHTLQYAQYVYLIKNIKQNLIYCFFFFFHAPLTYTNSTIKTNIHNKNDFLCIITVLFRLLVVQAFIVIY